MTDNQKRIIRNFTNSIERTKRALEIARSFQYSNIKDLETQLSDKKEKLKKYKTKIKKI